MVFDVPHSGRFLPNHFNYACQRDELDYLQDPYVEYLLDKVHLFNAPVLINHIHRTMVDMNRHENEINPLEIKGIWRNPTRQGQYVKNGHGVIPMRLSGPLSLTEIYNDATRPTAFDVNKRLIWFHRPYHYFLNKMMDEAHDFNGFAIHLNMHSMYRQGGQGSPDRPDICIGTLNGSSSHPLLDKFVEAFFKKNGLTVGMNDPFMGAALVQTTNNPKKARYSIQIEFAHDLYMNTDYYKISPDKCQKMSDIMARFTEEMDCLIQTHAAELKKGYTPPKQQAPQHP